MYGVSGNADVAHANANGKDEAVSVAAIGSSSAANTSRAEATASSGLFASPFSAIAADTVYGVSGNADVAHANANANGKDEAVSVAAIGLSFNDGPMAVMSPSNPPSPPRPVVERELSGVGRSSNCEFESPHAPATRYGRTRQQHQSALAAAEDADIVIPEDNEGHPIVDESKDQPEHVPLPAVAGGPMSPAQAAAPPSAATSAARPSGTSPLDADAVNAMNAVTLKTELERRGLRRPTSAVVTKERATTHGLATTNTSDVLQPINAARHLLRTSSLLVAVAAKADARTSGPIGTGMVWYDVAPDAAPVPPPPQATAAAPDPSGLGCGPGNIKAQFTGVCPPRPRFDRRTSVPALVDGKTTKLNGRLVYEPYEMSIAKGGDGRGLPNPEFAQQHGLTAASHPSAYTDVYYPLSEHKIRWGNANRTAHLQGQSPGKTLATSNKSRAWSRFQLSEAVIFHFLRRGNGLCPTPQLNFKLRDPSTMPLP